MEWVRSTVVPFPATMIQRMGDHFGGDYLNDSVDTLQLPTLPLSGLARPILSFVQWVDIDSEGDIGRIEGNIEGIWSTLDPVYGYPYEDGFTGSNVAWEQVFVDLSGLDDLSQVRLQPRNKNE